MGLGSPSNTVYHTVIQSRATQTRHRDRAELKLTVSHRWYQRHMLPFPRVLAHISDHQHRLVALLCSSAVIVHVVSSQIDTSISQPVAVGKSLPCIRYLIHAAKVPSIRYQQPPLSLSPSRPPLPSPSLPDHPPSPVFSHLSAPSLPSTTLFLVLPVKVSTCAPAPAPCPSAVPGCVGSTGAL